MRDLATLKEKELTAARTAAKKELEERVSEVEKEWHAKVRQEREATKGSLDREWQERLRDELQSLR
jgi:gas vesicle protein